MSIEIVTSMIGAAGRFAQLTNPSTGISSAFMSNWRQMAMKAVRHAKKCILEAMSSQNLAPLSGATIALKGTNTLLVETGKLRDSVIAKQETPTSFYGGIDLNARNDKGMNIGWLATLHQSGYTIEVTQEIRNKFRAVGINLRDDTKVLIVPPRPFVMMGLQKAMDDIEKMIFGVGRATAVQVGAL